MDIDIIYRNLGEFVVTFQWIEDCFRQIGWLILDPDRQNWPPRDLRDESFRDLINRVQGLYLAVIDRVLPDDREERKKEFRSIVSDSHKLHRYRNRLVHSAYIGVKAGGEVVALLRSNPKLEEDPKTGELQWDQETLTEKSFQSGIEQMANVGGALSRHYLQLIHWVPRMGAGHDT